MRWKAVYLLLTILALLGILGFFFLDSILGWTIEKSLETITGAKVEVNGLHLNLWQLKMSIHNLQIANPRNTWQNLIETRDIIFQMEATPLYSGKIVIDEVAIEDLMINTPRKTDGKLKKFVLPGPLGQIQKKLNRDIAALPVLDPNSIKNPVNTDKILASYQMKTELSTVVIKNRIEESKNKWQQNLQKLETTKEQIRQLQKKLEAFQASSPRNLQEIRDKIQQLQDLQKSGGDIQKEISETDSNFVNEFNNLHDNIRGLKDAAKEDYQSLLKLAKLPNFESVNITEALLGESLLNETSFALDMVDNIQKKIPVTIQSPPKEVHPRGGQDITFPGRKTYPRFLIKHAGISTQGTPASVFEGYYAKGSASGITSEPLLYGAPMILQLSAEAPNHAFLKFDGSLNHLTPAINDQFNLTMGKIPLPEFKLSENPLLPTRLASGNIYMIAAMNIKADGFKLNLDFEGRDLVCDYSGKPDSNNLLIQIIRETITRIDQVAVHYQLASENKKLQMHISSDLDEIVNARIKEVVGAQIEKATQELRRRVDEELQKKQQELNALCNQYQTELAARIKQVQDMVDQEKQNIEKARQELNDKLKQQNQELNNKLDQQKQELNEKLKQQLQQLQLPKFK